MKIRNFLIGDIYRAYKVCFQNGKKVLGTKYIRTALLYKDDDLDCYYDVIYNKYYPERLNSSNRIGDEMVYQPSFCLLFEQNIDQEIEKNVAIDKFKVKIKQKGVKK